MKRKVSLIGPSTLVVSLPCKWAKVNNIKKGDEVDVEIEQERLIIAKERKDLLLGMIEIKLREAESQSSLVGHLSGADPFFIMTYLVGPYVQGYNVIKINYQSKKTLDSIKWALANFLLGFEIFEQKENSVLIKSVVKGYDEGFDALFQRSVHVLLSMSKDIYDAVSRQEPHRLEAIAALEDLHDKLNYFCRRMLNVEIYYSKKFKIQSIYRILSSMEEIGDCYRYIASHIFSQKLKLSGQAVALLKLTNETMEIVFKSINTFNHDDLWKIRINYETLRNPQNLTKLAKTDLSVYAYLLTITQKLIHLGAEELLH